MVFEWLTGQCYIFFTLMLKVKCMLSAFSFPSTWILVLVQQNEEKLMQIWCVADAIYVFCHVCGAHNENGGKCSHSLFGNRKYQTKCIQTTLYSHYL